jgi:hypothetical protein
LVSLFVPVLARFAGWLATFFGSWLLMGIFGFLAEALPRFLGLGQGLISWGMGVAASAAFSAFQAAFSMAGVSLPRFADLLSDLPVEIVWAGSALRIHKVVYVLVSIPIIRLLRKVLERMASAAAGDGASSLLEGGR